MQVPVGINTGLTGIPFWGTDIGGFVPTPDYTGELYVRWFQFGAFCPLFRSHGRDLEAAAAVGLEHRRVRARGIRRQPAARHAPDPEELHNAAVEPICRSISSCAIG